MHGRDVGGAVANVQRTRVGFTAFGSNALGNSGSRIAVNVGDEHGGARFGQSSGNGSADTPAGTGHHRRTARQIEVSHQ